MRTTGDSMRAAVLLGSMQLARLTGRLGNQRLMAIGIMVMSLYPALTALTRELGLFLATAVVGGLAWSLVGGAISNYILERIPEDDRPAHLAWYNLALSADIGHCGRGSLLGGVIAVALGIIELATNCTNFHEREVNPGQLLSGRA